MFDLSPDLNSGKIKAVFQALGLFPSFNEELKMLVREGASADAHSRNTLAGMPSGPVAEFARMERSIFVTTLSVIKILDMVGVVSEFLQM